MSNRAGKREREARNRPKRGLIWKSDWQTPGGPPVSAVKLGLKKSLAGFEGSKRAASTLREKRMAAVPVADSRTSV
jgi:hypothetical protein